MKKLPHLHRITAFMSILFLFTGCRSYEPATELPHVIGLAPAEYPDVQVTVAPEALRYWVDRRTGGDDALTLDEQGQATATLKRYDALVFAQRYLTLRLEYQGPSEEGFQFTEILITYPPGAARQEQVSRWAVPAYQQED